MSKNWKNSKRNGRGKTSKRNTRYEKNNVRDNNNLTDTGALSEDSPEKNKLEGGKLSSLNDFSWYSRYPELLAAAASIPYPYRPGMKMNAGQIVGYGGDGETRKLFSTDYTLPGVLQIRWIPSMPTSSKATDPAAIAAREIYAKVRKAFSGRLYADGPDFIIYIMALDSIYAYIGWLNRIYRTICAYTPENYYAPDGLLRAYGMNQDFIDSVKQNQMQFFQIITELVHMVSKFNCPAVMDLMDRHYWMSKNVYSDSPSANSQLYVFNPYALFTFALVDTPDNVAAGGLNLKVIEDVIYSVDDAFNQGRDMIDKLAAWEDSYTISGYLARAFEGSPMYAPEFPVLNDVVTFEYQEEVLSQIENTYCDGFFPESDIAAGKLNVSQDPKTNSIIWQPYITAASGTNTNPTFSNYRTDLLYNMINVHSYSPSVENTVVATRLHCPVDTSNLEDPGVIPIPAGTKLPILCGTEWVGGMKLIFKQNDLFKSIPFVNSWVLDIPHLTDAVLAQIIQVELLLRQWDWAPCLKTAVFGDENAFLGVTYSWDVWNTTKLDKSDLREIHRICTYSEFNAFSI